MHLLPRGYRPRGRRPVAERAKRPFRVVFHSPFFDHDLRLLQGIKNLSVQALIPQLPVEAFAIAVLPRTSSLDVQRSCAHIRVSMRMVLGVKLFLAAAFLLCIFSQSSSLRTDRGSLEAQLVARTKPHPISFLSFPHSSFKTTRAYPLELPAVH